MLHSTDPNPQSFNEGMLRDLANFEGSLSQRTYQSLKEAILALRCPPGMFLRKNEICEILNISRSPVSEAMGKLASEGLVDIIPQAGTKVARFSMEEIREGAFLREALELAAIEHLATHITEAELKELRRNLRVQKAVTDDNDAEEFYHQDAAFHQLIHNFTGYPRLAKMAATAWVNVDRARQLMLPMPGRMTDTLKEHEDIIAALEAKNAYQARAAMRYHLSRLLDLLEPLEGKYPDYFVSSSKP